VKQIGPKTTVYNLVEAFPFLAEALPEVYPEFAPLKNSAFRATMGRVATLERAAGMAGVPVEKLLVDIGKLIETRTGDTVLIEGAEPPERRAEKIAGLKRIIEKLHAGGSLEEAQREFEAVAGGASPEEIAEMEQELIRGGMPVESIHRLCDVHVNVFRQSLDGQDALTLPAGHPIHTYMAENRAIEQSANRWAAVCRRVDDTVPPTREEFASALKDLAQAEVHYTRKENQLFPALERHGFTGPSQVMWGVHDDIRKQIKSVRASIESGELKQAAGDGLELARQIAEMVYKEEKILFPTSMTLITEEEWVEIRAGDDAIGYAFVGPGHEWNPAISQMSETDDAASESINLSTGALSREQLDRMLVSLPVEISYVDDQDVVRFYSDHAHRIFPRSPGVIGRTVQNCHPQKSLHMVEAILNAFKNGVRDTAQFWLEMKGRFVLVSYYAVRSRTGKYLGCIEVTQDVTDIRALQGERRLLEWD
jgi:uncharacterized protein